MKKIKKKNLYTVFDFFVEGPYIYCRKKITAHYNLIFKDDDSLLCKASTTPDACKK
jgi:hypothetical protein